MKVAEELNEYGFRTNDNCIFYKQMHQTSFLVVEQLSKLGVEGEARYSFYRINRNKKTYYYERDISVYWLMRRVHDYFEYLKEKRLKERLAPYGGSERKYRQHLNETRRVDEKTKDVNRQMTENHLLLYEGKKRRKIPEGQMVLDLGLKEFK